MQAGNPMEAMLRALQVHGAQQGVLQNQRAVEDDNALRQATMQAGGDQNKLMQLLQDMGQYGAVQKVQKSIFDQQKGAADIGKVRADTAKQYSDIDKDKFAIAEKRLNLAGQAFGWVRDNPSIEAAHAVADYLGENGIWSPEQVTQAKARAAQNPAPEAIKALATQAYQSALSAKDQLPTYMQQTRGGTVATQQINPVTGQVQDVQSAPVTESEAQRLAREERAAQAAADLAEQKRRTNLTDARAREGLRLQGERLAFDKTKGPDDKPLNDAQSKALLFGSRMRAANEVLDSLAQAGTTTSIPGSRAGYGVGPVITAFSSAQKQQLDQAKRDFVNAVLRRESGAVISDSEFDNADKQYFPQIGDSKQVIEQKRKNRQLAMDGILAEVPANKRDSLVKPGGGASGGWDNNSDPLGLRR